MGEASTYSVECRRVILGISLSNDAVVIHYKNDSKLDQKRKNSLHVEYRPLNDLMKQNYSRSPELLTKTSNLVAGALGEKNNGVTPRNQILV